MGFGDDDRGQSIQIGAIILFGALIIALSSYQAFVVPDQNQDVEFKHSQAVQDQLNDLRSTVVSMAETTTTQATTVQLGVDYPSRALFVNPGPASGTLRTAGTADAAVNVTIDNATATGETGDFWRGVPRTYNTGQLVYEPNYNLYQRAPTTIYSNTVLYNDFGGQTLAKSSQALINGDRITIVTLNGSYSTGRSGSISVDFRPVSTAAKTVTVTNETDSNVTLQLTTRLNESEWEALLADEMVAAGGNVVNVSTSPLPDGSERRLTVELAGNRTYDLQMFKVGVGSRVSETDDAYLTDVEGEKTTVQRGETTKVILEVRDAYNNPKGDVTVNASVTAGDFDESNSRAVSAVDGQVTFTYNSSGVPAGTTQQLNFTLGERRPGFNHSTPENVTVNVSVRDAGTTTDDSGSYTVFWKDPSTGQNGVTCPDGAGGVCTVDASQTTSVTLPMDTSPTADGATVTYAVNDTAVGTISPSTGTTNSDGEDSTTFTPAGTGGVKVYTDSGSSGDTLVLDVVNLVGALVYNSDATAEDGPDVDTVTGGVEFTITNQFSQSLSITEVEISEPTGPANYLTDDESPNDQPRTTELYVAGDLNDGWVDEGGGIELPNTFDMDSDGIDNNGNPELSSGGFATVYLYEFSQPRGTGISRIDMTDRTFDVTLTYELANGTVDTTTIPVTPS